MQLDGTQTITEQLYATLQASGCRKAGIVERLYRHVHDPGTGLACEQRLVVTRNGIDEAVIRDDDPARLLGASHSLLDNEVVEQAVRLI